MQTSLVWTMAIIALVTMFFGYYFGLVEGRVRAERKHKKELEGGAAGLLQTPPAPVVVDDPGLLRLKEANGQLQVEMDGALIHANALAPEQRKRLIELITRLRPLVEARSAAPGSQAFGFASQERPQPIPVPQPAVAVTAASVTTPRKEIPAAPQSMVAQIDAILQEKIENTPLAQRGVKLEEAPGGAVNVVVGINRYEGVGDVPDPEVQAAIRAAITEWERKFTPG